MDRCALCPRTHNIVLSNGPLTARIMSIAEAPGQTEDRCGVPFSGQAGMEYNDNYLPLAGLHRTDIRQANVVSCRPEQNKKPTDSLARSCADHHIAAELLEVYPEVVLLLGATAVNTLCDGVDLDAQHGIPFRGKIYDWEGWIVPMWHPASGLHNTSMMTPMLEDWEKLRPWLESMDRMEMEWQWGVDRFVDSTGQSTRDYRLCRTAQSVRDYFLDYPIGEYFGGDTESHAGVPWSVQVSTEIGTGMMVLMTDHDALHELGLTLAVAFGSFFESCLVLHNQESDIDIFSELVGFVIDRYEDTQQQAYQLQNLPQGLKALSFRLLGRKRIGWKELVGGASRSKLMEWMWLAKSIAEDELRTEEPRFGKSGKPIKPKLIKHPIEKVLNHVLLHTNKTQGDKPYDPWKYFKQVTPSVQYLVGMSRIVEQIGTMPQLGIANCSLDDSRMYSASDADDTLAIHEELKRLRIEAEDSWDVQEGDVDGPRVVEGMSGVNLERN